jgi:cytochrome c553
MVFRFHYMVVIAVGASLSAHAAPVDFSRDVLPVLAAKCFECHGPDAAERKAKLRLDERASAFGELRPGERVIVPGNPDASLLVQRVLHADPEERMPPAEFPKQLTDAERDMLRQWVAEGAAWEGHWAFEPLDNPEPPTVNQGGWPRNAIDNFILAALEARGMSPAPEADRRTLMRRVYFDLIGLPPTPEEVAAFVDDPAPDAYEQLVERLLDSPRHGERWARHWLDVAHYGETHGYDKDKRRPNAWPYRDYVIQSLNADKPYGRFVEEQIAGDVLYPEDPQATVATGFVAAGPWDFVGHVELREGTVDKDITRTLDRDDMVANVMNTFTSLTVHCARCHDHKFDPIKQTDYYALQAVFAGVDRADRPYGPDADTQARRAALSREQEMMAARVAATETLLSAVTSPELSTLEAKRAELEAAIAAADVRESPSNGYHSEIEMNADVVKWVQVDLGAGMAIDGIRLVPAFPTDFAETPGFGFPPRLKVELSDDPAFTSAHVLADYTAHDFPERTDQPYTIAANGAAGRYVRVTATRLWKRLDDYVFALAELQVMAGRGNVALGKAVNALDSIDSGRWNTAHLVDGYDSRNRLDEGAQSRDEQRALHKLKVELRRATRERDGLRLAALTEQEGADYAAAQDGLSKVKAALAALPTPVMVYAAAPSFSAEGSFAPSPAPREIHVLTRGEVNAPADRAWPGAVGCVPGLDSDFGMREGYREGEARAALARWISREDNPLTWRSVVNRVWHYHFGKGLVDTPNDFGRMGSPPTHPELLDWLASDFLKQEQSLKALHRTIVTSATYRQSSISDQDYTAQDGSNQYLWRMERRALDAEALRDSVLAISGKLDLTMGGPPFDTFAFEDDHSPRYLYAQLDPSDARAFRRSIYRSIVRSVPDPWMTTLDCADPSQSVPVRNQTITALQALALYNNPMVTRQAAYLAERVAQESPTMDGHLARAWELAVGRAPKVEELQTITAYAQQHGLAAACRVILNTNEFLFVD